MENNKKYFVMNYILLLLAIMLLFTGSNFNVTAKSSVRLNHTKITMQTGKTKTLKLSGANKKIKWKSSNKSVVKVSKKGKNKAILTAKDAGTAIITATVGRKNYMCKVTVKYKKYKDIYVTVGKKTYTLTLYDNASAKQLYKKLPMSITMNELNGNEKYHYFSDSLPVNSKQVGEIRSGDLMLYGSDCLVLFYKDFSTSYSYTKLGYIKDATGLVNALGNGNVQVTFSK